MCNIHQGFAEQESQRMANMNDTTQARKDIRLLTGYVIHGNKRRTVPQGVVPLEVLTMLLAPNFTRKKGTPGLQADGEALADSRETLCFIAGPANPSHGAPLGELQRSCTHAQECKAQKLRAPHAKRAMLAVQTMIHRTQCTPLRWHCSQATAIDKHNGKTGARGAG